MAIGFMTMRKTGIRKVYFIALLTLFWGAHALAAEVALVGLLPGRAIVMVDGGKRQTLSVGAKTEEGVKLLGIESGAATFEIDGRQRRMQIGQSVVATASSARPELRLTADARGHFVVPGSINGSQVRFLVDTGASFVSLGLSDALRARIDYTKGTPGYSMTANGQARVWKVKLNNLKVGGISLTEVDGTVHEQDMPVVLLGMSFLNRMEMKRDGQEMILTQRY